MERFLAQLEVKALVGQVLEVCIALLPYNTLEMLIKRKSKNLKLSKTRDKNKKVMSIKI